MIQQSAKPECSIQDELWPQWLRWGVMAIAVLVLCSCQSSQRLAQNPFATDSKEVLANNSDAVPVSDAIAAQVSAVRASDSRSLLQKPFSRNSAPATSQAFVQSTDNSPVQQVAYNDYQQTEFPQTNVSQGNIPPQVQLAPGEIFLGETTPNEFYNEPMNPPAEFVREGSELPGCDASVGNCQSPAGLPCQSCQSCQTGVACVPCIPDTKAKRDEYLCDGGDAIAPAGMRKNGTIAGIEPTDTVAAYDTVDGRTIIKPSNKVCIYAPRFNAVRKVTGAIIHQQRRLVERMQLDQSLVKIDERQIAGTELQRIDLQLNRGTAPSSLLRARQQSGGVETLLGTITVDGSLLPFANVSLMRTGQFDRSEGAIVAKGVLAAITWSDEQAVQVTLDSKQAHAAVGTEQAGLIFELKEPNRPKLRIIKLASERTAKPGDTIHFTLRYDNIGDRVIGNVTIVDSLTTRLEYVPKSSKSDRDAEFTSRGNDAGSLKLRWDIKKPLEPGQGGIITFECRVR